MTVPDAPGGGDEIEFAPPPPAGRLLMVNLVGAIGAGTLTALLAMQMPSWPRGGALSLVYLLMSPFLLAPPLWTAVGASFAAQLLYSGRGEGWRWVGWTGVATGVLLAVLSWPPYFRGLYALIT